jgi:hypothetical protein
LPVLRVVSHLRRIHAMRQTHSENAWKGFLHSSHVLKSNAQWCTEWHSIECTITEEHLQNV